MIQSFKLKLINDRYLVTVVYNNRGVPAILSRFAPTEQKADNIAKALEKQVLRDKITKFLHHRQNIMDFHGGLRTQEKLTVWESVSKNFEYLSDKSLESNCKFILTSKRYFDSLMPGAKSRFHQSTWETMQEIYAFCETKIITESSTKTTNTIPQ